ncbi:Decapping nuclease DXO-like [Gracilariopsis chorda]|uniref:Decapping nuclease n=1 Tax=Gracilariopsis chorda TaxID=448386 RepID=A0A2V3J522_9FLOR|nr:Decapping nuclease DXO-like [Gracilariopsis chorda]|eukprot:PXF49538.1 Decapping nuclease DXO-like [Gracilariopsis chorda]
MERSTASKPSIPDSHGKSAIRIDVRRWMESDASRSTKLHISEPREVACFSRGADRKVQYGDRRELKRYREPALNSNLGDKLDCFVPKADEMANVDTIVEALEHDGYNRMEEIDVVTFRNNLNKIGGTPYNKRNDWEIDCAMVGNTVFLDIRKIDEDKPNPYAFRFMYYGYRFEAICTGAEEELVNANSEFCSVARLRLGNHRIIMSAEIDCTTGDPKNVDNPVRSYLELKTMREVRSDKELGNMYRHRFPKYWIQSYLAGVRHIALGLRSDDGELLAVKRLETHRLHREAREFFNERRMRGCWEPFACLNFIDFVLDNIRRACGRQPGSTLRLRYNAKTDIIEGDFLRDDESHIGARMASRYTP